MPEKYFVVAATSELETVNQMHIELNSDEILLCRDGENYFAVSYFCSHEEFSLEGGDIYNGCITCPYHGAEFDLKDGSVLAPPAFEPIKTYAVKVEDNTISIGIDD